MYCKKCGNEIGEDLLCPKCGFQNVLNPPVKNSLNVNDEHNIKYERNIVWAILSGIMFLISVYPFYQGYDKMNNYYSSDSFYSLNKNAYVGGDAYNYIINAGYATAYYVLAIGFALLGVGFLIVYYVSVRKAKCN